MTLKMAVVAPMPSASVSVAKIVKPGVRNSVRAATRNVFTNGDRILSGRERKQLFSVERLEFGRFCATYLLAFLRNFFC